MHWIIISELYYATVAAKWSFNLVWAFTLTLYYSWIPYQLTALLSLCRSYPIGRCGVCWHGDELVRMLKRWYRSTQLFPCRGRWSHLHQWVMWSTASYACNQRRSDMRARIPTSGAGAFGLDVITWPHWHQCTELVVIRTRMSDLLCMQFFTACSSYM